MGLLDIVGNILGIGGSKQPDYTQAAIAQGAANKETALAQALLNNPNTYTPFGSQTWSGPVDGTGRPTLTQTLSPAEQEKLNQANRIQSGSLNILEGNLGNLDRALSGSFRMPGQALTDYDPRYAPTGRTPTSLNLSGIPGMPQADAGVLQQVEDAMYGQGSQYLDPQYRQMEQALTSRLANQGIVPGTEAYNDASENFRLGKQKAYGDLRNSAILGGQQAMQDLYNLALSGRQQGFNESLGQGQFAQQGIGQQAQIASNQAGISNQGRAQNLNELVQEKTMPLNQINALLTGSQVNNPQFQPTTPTSITPPPLLQGAQLQGQANAADSSRKSGFWGQVLGAAGNIFRPGG